MKKITPIAMKCNKEQFEAIKPKLEKIKKYSVTDFNAYPYLTNTDGNSDTISNIRKGSFGNTWIRVRKTYETWNESIFLEACGIEREKTFEITKETIIKYKMKDEFPEVFEVKLDVGKWYRNNECDKMFCFNGYYDYDRDPKGYGFVSINRWVESNDIGWSGELKEATEQEVFEALKNEAVKRGFVEGVYFNSVISNDVFKFNKIFFHGDNSMVWSKGGGVIFKNGNWATIIPTKTKEEAEKLLNCKIID